MSITLRLAENDIALVNPDTLDVSTLPNECVNRQKAAAELSTASRLLQIKEHLLEMATAEKQQYILQAQTELQRWDTLASEYAGELAKTSLVCVFCQRKCLPDTVNAPCPSNPSDIVRGTFDAGRRAEPVLQACPELSAQEAETYVGTGRHHFVPAAPVSTGRDSTIGGRGVSQSSSRASSNTRGNVGSAVNASGMGTTW
ncbi:hypothetical protein KIPB_002280 [Kipferlia bialata]|uniref:Uncharacterized protein n=1 Tax=Kipferlia bialata TaxID=797122 RepID=A0A9K3CS76_9EUKA|nr:hypothetical protein KIPB_002280 [Kipferlia bialata]|eukprot:g2280.t1